MHIIAVKAEMAAEYRTRLEGLEAETRRRRTFA